ncbi:MAG TPA: hypothetical protein VMB03_28280 [Bryobacteraceae bacterium]|nr:hypothetical protein [Bryobacteraceae bacterium]
MERHRRSAADRPEPAPVVPAVELPGSPPALADDAGVQIVYGASLQRLPLAGQVVGHIRPALEMMLRVDRRSPALVNGQQVSADYVLAPGDVLEFIHRAGEKGVE